MSILSSESLPIILRHTHHCCFVETLRQWKGPTSNCRPAASTDSSNKAAPSGSAIGHTMFVCGGLRFLSLHPSPCPATVTTAASVDTALSQKPGSCQSSRSERYGFVVHAVRGTKISRLVRARYYTLVNSGMLSLCRISKNGSQQREERLIPRQGARQYSRGRVPATSRGAITEFRQMQCGEQFPHKDSPICA